MLRVKHITDKTTLRCVPLVTSNDSTLLNLSNVGLLYTSFIHIRINLSKSRFSWDTRCIPQIT